MFNKKYIIAVTAASMFIFSTNAFAQRSPALDPGCAFMKSLYEYIAPTAGC